MQRVSLQSLLLQWMSHPFHDNFGTLFPLLQLKLRACGTGAEIWHDWLDAMMYQGR